MFNIYIYMMIIHAHNTAYIIYELVMINKDSGARDNGKNQDHGGRGRFRGKACVPNLGGIG